MTELYVSKEGKTYSTINWSISNATVCIKDRVFDM